MTDPDTKPGEGLREVIHAWLREDTNLTVKMGITAHAVTKLIERLQAHPANGQSGGGDVLARLVAECESFDRAPDNARVWIGGWSTYSGQRDPSLVHVGDLRDALHPQGASDDRG